MPLSFDYLGSLRRFGNDRRLFREMVDFFLSDYPSSLEELREAVAAGDARRIHRAAHTLKGMVANFGAAQASSTAAQVEEHAKLGNVNAAARSLPLLEDALRELHQALAVHRREDASSAPRDGSSR